MTHTQGSPELMEVKMSTDNFSNSGNDTNSDENDNRRRRTDDTDEVSVGWFFLGVNFGN
jgi:hypothetical protein